MTDPTAMAARLHDIGIAHPTLVVDLDAFDANVDEAKAMVAPGLDIRIVAKSLPCLPLLRRVATRLGTTRLMTFADDMLATLLQDAPEFSHLLGKPFPVETARAVLADHPEATRKVAWLIDTRERLAHYEALAAEVGPLEVVLEVDVGLHRGGFRPVDISKLDALMSTAPNLRFAGVMGYDAHLVKMSDRKRKRAGAQVNKRLAQIAKHARAYRSDAIVNSGGSLTFRRYSTEQGVSEIAFGSVLVKPSHFDTADTKKFQPAAYIATPILKYLPDNPIPGLGPFRRFRRRQDRGQLAIWGGYWKADMIWPEGYRLSNAFGHSSNQEVWTGPLLNASPVDRPALFWPHQSEAVLREFGPIMAISKGSPPEFWDPI